MKEAQQKSATAWAAFHVMKADFAKKVDVAFAERALGTSSAVHMDAEDSDSEAEEEQTVASQWEVAYRRVTVAPSDMPVLIAAPQGDVAAVLNAMWARIATLEAGTEIPWLVTFEQLGATIPVAEQLVGSGIWTLFFPDGVAVVEGETVPRQLVLLLQHALRKGQEAYQQIVASEELKEQAREHFAVAEAASKRRRSR